jgi:threonine/homoserine/homoserine lactone efflux protein
MDASLFPRGLIIGLSVAAPVGPMAVLCIRRTIAYGRLTGLVSGAGIASADAVYGAIAAFGLTSISTFLVDRQDVVRLVGGVFLCYLGLRTLRSRAAEIAGSADAKGSAHAAAYLSTLGLTLTNPTTILSFAAIFSGFGIASEGAGAGSASALVAGVFLGSCLWWLTLTSGTSLLRGWLTAGRLTWLNRISGAAILIFGVLAIASILR